MPDINRIVNEYRAFSGDINVEPEERDNEPEVSTAELITIGSDPEFALIAPNGRAVSARDVYDADADDFGYDGNSSTAEIRPKPVNTPKEAVKEIKKILERNKKKYPQAYKYNLQAISKDLSLGGHIHFGHPSLRGGRGNEVVVQLVRNLDYLVALPTLYVERKEDSDYRRKSHSYGRISDYREQAWGFEYRTLPSFIGSRELTSCLFHLSHAVAEDTIQNDLKVKEFVEHESLKYAVNNHALQILKPHLREVFKYHKDLSRYKNDNEYKKEIQKFQRYVRAEKKLLVEEIKSAWKIKFDIKDFWKLEKIESLLDKVTKLLLQMHQEGLGRHTIHRKVSKGSYKDFNCVEIANYVNVAINKLTDKEVLKATPVDMTKIYGLKQDRGNVVRIGYHKHINYKKRKMILGMMWDIANNMPHKTKIDSIKFERWEHNTIGFGRAIRKENVLLAEAMSVVYILLANSELYKTTDKKKQLYTTKHKVVTPIVKNLKNKSVKLPEPVLELKKDKIRLCQPFDLNRSEFEIKNILSDIAPEYGSNMEISSILLRNGVYPLLDKMSRGKVNRKHKKTCIDSPATKLKDMCKVHMAKKLIRIINNSIPAPREGWGVQHRCQACSENFNGDDSRDRCECHLCYNCCENTCHMCFHHQDDCECCHTCENTRDNCTCFYCEGCDTSIPENDGHCDVCERCTECCECYWCESCGNHTHIDSGNWCSDCDSCDSCCDCIHCEGGNHNTTLSERDGGLEWCEGCASCENHCSCETEETEGSTE